MKELYETKISDARWWLYDIPGNIGWIIYYVCYVRLVLQGFNLFTVASSVPAVLMLIGIIELISERIVKIARLLPKKRLFRGFGSLTLGGVFGVVVTVIGLATDSCGWWMLLGSILCAVFAGLLYKGYKKVNQ